MTPRIWIDANSDVGDGVFGILQFEDKEFQESAESIGAYDGMPIIMFYSDTFEEFEWDGFLRRRVHPFSGGKPVWVAEPIESTFRRIK